MSPSQVDEALEAMRGLFPETPLQLNEHLSARYGANVYLKREDLTPVRSYKIRGAFNFFRKIVADSPVGTTFVCASAGNHAQGVALSAGRSIAVDRQSIPYGTLVWLASSGPAAQLQRLVVAQDTGSAIVGPVRADYFAGTGDEAGRLASRVNQPLRLWVLWPR